VLTVPVKAARSTGSKRFRRRRRRVNRADRPTPAYILKAPHRRPTLIGGLTPGNCRFCANDVAQGAHVERYGPRMWHDGRADEPNCWHEWKMQTRPLYAKKVLADERGRSCEKCDRRGRGFTWLHLDHIVPLADGGAFTADNMQLLCPDCHSAKTISENVARAAARKIARAAAKLVQAACTTIELPDTVIQTSLRATA